MLKIGERKRPGNLVGIIWLSSMKIAVGTTSKHKLKFLQDLIEENKFEVETVPVEAQSLVSDQPLSSDETKQGSINRSMDALSKVNDADFGMGIEVGYELIDGKYNILCWTTLINAGQINSFCSEPFPLPDFHHKILTQNLFLGDHVRIFEAQSGDPGYKKLAWDIIYREPYIKDSLNKAIKFINMSN